MTNHILRRLYVTGPLNALAITCLTAGCFLFAADKVISICMFSDVTSVITRGMSGNANSKEETEWHDPERGTCMYLQVPWYTITNVTWT